MEYQELIENQPSSNGHQAKINPWLHIWTRTGATLQYVFTYQREHFIHRHFMLLGFIFMLSARIPDWLSTPPHPIGVLIQTLLMGPVGAMIASYVLAAVARNIGARFGGEKVKSNIMRAAVAWTNYPLAVAWTIFIGSYLLIHQFQPPTIQNTIWLFEGFLGWLPVLIAAIPFLIAFYIRIKAVSYTLNLSIATSLIVWVLTVILAFTPFIVVGGAYFTIFRATVSIAQQAAG